MFLPLVWIMTDPRSLQERVEAYLKIKSIIFLICGTLLILGTLSIGFSFPWPNSFLDRVIILIGPTIFVIGMVLSIWAKVTMKSGWGLPAEHDIKRQNKIIAKGPFAFSRNPIYLGLILVVLGYTLSLRSYSILFVPIILFYFYRVILKEEKFLTKHFGIKYLEYKSKVPRFI